MGGGIECSPPSLLPRPSPDASSIPCPLVPRENSMCLKMLLGRLNLLPAGTVASQWRTLHCGVNHSLPSGVPQGWGRLSPSLRPLGISTFIYGCHKGYFLICNLADSPLAAAGSLVWGALGHHCFLCLIWFGKWEGSQDGFFPREGDCGTQQLIKGMWC